MLNSTIGELQTHLCTISFGFAVALIMHLHQEVGTSGQKPTSAVRDKLRGLARGPTADRTKLWLVAPIKYRREKADAHADGVARPAIAGERIGVRLGFFFQFLCLAGCIE